MVLFACVMMVLRIRVLSKAVPLGRIFGSDNSVIFPGGMIRAYLRRCIYMYLPTETNYHPLCYLHSLLR